MALILFVILSAIWVLGGAWWSWRHHKDEDFADYATLFYSAYIVFGCLVVGIMTVLLIKVGEWFG